MAGTPPTGASNGELVRWIFELLDTHEIEPLRRVWTDATVGRFPAATLRGADALLPPDASGADHATKAAFNAETRLVARLRDRRRR
ncbi:MAG TPA: hypothetical protein VNT54_06865 [Solirubrobacteraceae bacterium]|nr:hypothetical protein [Solirubrobacteraceae bacterium]